MIAEELVTDEVTVDDDASSHAFCTLCYPIDSAVIFALCGTKKGGEFIGYSAKPIACDTCEGTSHCPRCGVKLARA